MNESSSPHSAALLAALRDAPVNAAVEGALKTRVHLRLSASLLGLAPTLEGGLPRVSATSGSHAISLGGASRGAATSKVLIAALAPVFALGVLTGVAADRWQQQHAASQARQSMAASPVVVSSQTVPPIALQPILTPEDLAQVTPAKSGANGASTSAPSDTSSTLAAERALLDQARHALASGEPGAGLAPLERHAARFPKGVLTEEREALAVRVLTAVGNSNAAIARAQSFHRRFPNSLFTPAVDNAIATISRRNSGTDSNP